MSSVSGGWDGPSIVKDGLVLYFDAGSPNSYYITTNPTGLKDISVVGSITSGSLINGVAWASTDGGVFRFDGVDDYIIAGINQYRYQDNFTIEAISKFTTIPDNAGGGCGARYPIVYNHDYGYNMLVNGAGKVLWQIYNTPSNNNSITSSAIITGSGYFHSVGTKLGVSMSFYMNGTLEAEKSLTTNAVYYDTSLPFVIGGFATCGTSKFYSLGNIATVRVYNRSLSAAEVNQNFQATRARFGI